MKHSAEKTRKQRGRESPKTQRQQCGTLSYLAECRGLIRREEAPRWASPPTGGARIRTWMV